MAQASPSPASVPSAPSASVPTGATKIAVIAFQPAVASTNEGRAALAQVQQKFSPQQTQLKAMNDEIDTLKKQLQAAGSTLSQEERASRVRTIDDKEKTLQRQAQTDQSDFQQSMGEAYQGVAQKFYAVLQDYATKNGYGLVVDISGQQSPVVWAAKGADITEEVVKAYNAKSGVAAPAASSTTPKTTPHRGTSHSTRTPQ